MTQLTETIDAQLASMPQGQQAMYNALLDKGSENIFTAISGIHKDIKSGEISAEYAHTAGLALANLTEQLHGEPVPRVKSTEDAFAHLQYEIDSAEASGDTQRAALLQAALQNTLDPSERQIEADKKFIADNELMLLGLQAQKQERYDTAVEVEKDRHIQSLRYGGQRTPDEALAHYEEFYEPKVLDALAKVYGI